MNVITSFLADPDVGVYLDPDTCFTFELNDAEAEAIGARLNKKMLYKTLPMLGQ